MPLKKVNDIIESLIEKDKNIQFEGLECWVYSESNYNIYIFSIQIENQSALLEIHEELRDYIAIYFQSQLLEKDVERWNIYQFYFMKEKIDYVTKQLIEQDKFSTRKIIHDDKNKVLSDNEIIALINEELFDFEMIPRTLASESVDEFLTSMKHQKVLSILSNRLSDEQLIKTLGHE